MRGMSQKSRRRRVGFISGMGCIKEEVASTSSSFYLFISKLDKVAPPWLMLCSHNMKSKIKDKSLSSGIGLLYGLRTGYTLHSIRALFLLPPPPLFIQLWGRSVKAEDIYKKKKNCQSKWYKFVESGIRLCEKLALCGMRIAEVHPRISIFEHCFEWSSDA